MKLIGCNSTYGEREEVGFIQRIEEGITCFLTPECSILIAMHPVVVEPVSTTTHLLAMTLIEEINDLLPGLTVSFKPRHYISIPPFLLDMICSSISNSEGSSKQPLIEVIQEIKNVDTTHAKNQDYIEKVKSKMQAIIEMKTEQQRSKEVYPLPLSVLRKMMELVANFKLDDAICWLLIGATLFFAIRSCKYV